MSESIYNSLFITKNNSTIPIFTSGKSMESRYNPQNDAERFLNTIRKSNFYLVLGIGSGIFIDFLSKKFPNSFILAVEINDKSLDFLDNLETVSSLKKNTNICFSTLDNLEKNLSNYYIPSFFGNLQIVEQKNWINENLKFLNIINTKIQNTLRIISADFSVQSHFGKIWNHNIIQNLKTFSEINDYLVDFNKLKLTQYKKAAIIAAGPSLDKTIQLLKENINNYFIISTDTAYPVLLKNKIIPQAVVSLDGQNISHSHFLQKENCISSTLFIFDLCSNSSSVHFISNYTKNIIFSCSGHPFCTFIKDFFPNSFINLYSGSGTVTILAFDFALNLGFSTIDIYGADFSYIDGKSYVKGTYLDDIFSFPSNKINTLEYNFDKLLYRTELKNITENKKTTDILDSYKTSFEDYLKYNNFSFFKNNDIYFTNNFTKNLNLINSNLNIKKLQKMDFQSLKNSVFSLISDDFSQKNIFSNLNKLDISLLPLISWLRFYDNNNNEFSKYLEKAYFYLTRDFLYEK